ncbi:hypothetical protein DVH24_019901 [Malus domestica]|uniref:Uncharacterized protein n=1 Tax=Malus domestica TaxID=3750 RepID=A0A498I7D5_MALDO|nr:hypothetical protein DVH24_019901 [Malus domestica]
MDEVLLNCFVQLNVIFAPTRWAVFSCLKSPTPFLSRLLRDLVYFLAVLINFLPNSNCSLIFSSLPQIICAKSVSLFLVAGKKFGCYKFLAFEIPQSLRILFLFWIYQNQFFGSEVYSSWKEKKVKYTNELESKVTIFRISYPGKPGLPDEFFGFHIWHLCFVQIWGADAWVIKNFASDIFSSAAIKSVNRFPSLQGGCWVEFGYTDNAAVYHTKLWCSLGVSVLVGHLEGKAGKSRQLGSLSHSTLSNSTFFKKIPKMALEDWNWKYEGDLIFLAVHQEQRHEVHFSFFCFFFLSNFYVMMEVDSQSIPGMMRNWSSSGARSIWILGLRCSIDFYGTLDINLVLFSWWFDVFCAMFFAISSYKQQVEGLQDINQLVELLVPLLCDVSGVSEKKLFRGSATDFVSVIALSDIVLLHFQAVPVFIEVFYSQIEINLKELHLFAVFKFDPSTSRKYLCMDHYYNPFSTDELQTMKIFHYMKKIDRCSAHFAEKGIQQCSTAATRGQPS